MIKCTCEKPNLNYDKKNCTLCNNEIPYKQWIALILIDIAERITAIEEEISTSY